MAGTLELEDSEAATAAAQERLRSIQALNRRLAQNSEDLLPLQHVITAELYMPRDFAASLLVHVAQEPALINVLQVRSRHHSLWSRALRARRNADGCCDPRCLTGKCIGAGAVQSQVRL